MTSLKITDIKQGVKNENRVNVFVNSKYAFSLDISQVVDFHIKIGLEITDAQLEEYKRASEFGKLYQRTLEWVLTRPHSTQETKDYLYRKTRTISQKTQSPVGNLTEISHDIIERLTVKGYLNDEKFAKYYVENRFVKKGISKKRLKLELMKKGVDRTIIDEVLSENSRNDEEEIKKIILKKRARYDDEKLVNYLVRQGFDFELARNLVQASCETD